MFGVGSQLSEFFSSLFTPFLAFDFRIMSFNANTNRPVRMLPNFAVKDHETSAVNSAQLALFHAFLLKILYTILHAGFIGLFNYSKIKLRLLVSLVSK